MAIALVLTMKASAQTKIDEIYYYLNSLLKTATVCNPYDDYFVDIRVGDVYSGNVIIPSKVTYNGETYNVTYIDECAFYHCSGLTSITIPNSVTTIERLAFNGCTSLTSLVIPNSVTFIGDYAFSGCIGLTSIKVESGNNVYDSRDNCNALIETKSNTLITGCTTTTIPSGITSISYNAFINCSGLTSVSIPNSVTSIGEYAFAYCSGLTSINVEAGNPKYDSRENSNAIIETASNTLIVGCKNSTIPNGVTSIGDRVFEFCSDLTSIEIPNSVTSIGNSAFNGCSGLTSITIPNSVTTIGDYAFCNCSGLTSATIGNNVTSIGEGAFSDCSGLTFITIPNSVTTIGDNAFRNCTGLTFITIPNSVTTIGDWAFADCSGLTSIKIPNSVTSVGGSAFHGTAWYNNQSDGMVYLDNFVYEYKGQMPNNTQIIIREGTTGIAGSAFASCSGLVSVTIPNSVTSIGDHAFRGCSGLNSVTIPNGVTSIGNYAFRYCSALTSVTIPNSVTFVGDYAFENCSGLTAITIPNSVTSIGVGAFDNCSGLLSVTIPESVTSIGEFVFENCSGLTSVTIPESVTSIGEFAFYECRGLTSVTIPNSVTSIGMSAFYGCIGLTSVTIPESVTSIGGSAFHGTTWYNNQPDGMIYLGNFVYEYKGQMPTNTQIIIREGTTGIAGSAFATCSGLASVTIPNSVASIGGSAFRYCSNLTSITIPNSVTSIGEYAFSGCSSMISVISEIEHPFEIDNTVFPFIPSNAQLIVPKGTKAKYQATAGWNQFTNVIEAGDIVPDLPGQIHKDDIYFKVIGSGEAEVVSVEEGEKSVSVPSTISHNNTTYKVTSIAKEVFDNRESLAAVIWEPEVQFNATVNNPNFLLYVKDEKYASHTVKNVVVNGVAERIELEDAASGNDFYCPRAFTAKNISYSHNYQMETGLGESKGWETIVLPFDVQKYTHATKGELETFTTWSRSSNKKPFWLFELTVDGYKDVAGIKANTPYIISMPNNKQYEQQYQIPGIVTFSATNVEVKKSDDMKSVSYQGRTFVPNYTNQNNADFLALNVSNNYVTNPGKDISGSKFVRGLRAVHPFEAYMTTTDNTRSIDVMDGMTTAIRGIQMVKDESSTIKVYDTRGVLLKFASNMDDVRNGLKSGVYIVNGKKIIIK